MTAEPQLGHPTRPGYLEPYGIPPGGPTGRGPSAGPVVGFTLLFGVISAARRADRARAVGDSTGRYWIAFGATFTGAWVVGAISLILLLALGGVFGDRADAAPRSNTAIALGQAIVTKGTFPDASGHTLHVKAASCTADPMTAGGQGAGTYLCHLGLAEGGTRDISVSLDTSGRWRVVQ